MTERSGCLVCGKRLVYSARHTPRKCALCGKTLPGHAACSFGHFVCDGCHRLGADEIIERTCIASETRDPLALALTLMQSPAVKMHGPEHHFLVPAVLIAAHYNSLGKPAGKRAKLREARRRAANVLGGFCGFYGDCGAAVGTGIFVSVVTGATCLSKKEWRSANLMTARSLRTVALHGGPRCCKRNTFLALGEAASFSRRELCSKMRMRRGVRCTFSPMNRECLKGGCPFHGAAAEKEEIR